jgi:hypothetical protein
MEEIKEREELNREERRMDTNIQIMEVKFRQRGLRGQPEKSHMPCASIWIFGSVLLKVLH